MILLFIFSSVHALNIEVVKPLVSETVSRVEKWFKDYDTGDQSLWKYKPRHCGQNYQEAELIGYPVVPGSGEHFVRSWTEYATGMITGDVRDSRPRGPRNYIVQSCQSGLMNTTQVNYQCWCGYTDNCEKVGVLPKPLLITTYFPLVTWHNSSVLNSSIFKTRHGADLQLERLLLVVRNPVDNYLAMQAQAQQGLNGVPTVTAASFLRMWLNFYDFWFEYAEQHCLQVFVLRYENLIKADLPYLKEMLRGAGQWASLGDEAKILEAFRTVPPPSREQQKRQVYFNTSVAKDFPSVLTKEFTTLLYSTQKLMAAIGYEEIPTAIRAFSYHAGEYKDPNRPDEDQVKPPSKPKKAKQIKEKEEKSPSFVPPGSTVSQPKEKLPINRWAEKPL